MELESIILGIFGLLIILLFLASGCLHQGREIRCRNSSNKLVIRNKSLSYTYYKGLGVLCIKDKSSVGQSCFLREEVDTQHFFTLWEKECNDNR